MYSPPHFRPPNPDTAWDLAHDHPVGLLITATGDLAPLPWLVDRENAAHRAHHAAASPIVFEGQVTVVFQGPDGNVSPTWYRAPHAHVPTWNYAVAVARGRAERLSRARTRKVLWDLCERFEPADGYRPSWIDGAFMDELLDAIVGVEVHVEDFTAKLKLSQNRAPEDRAGVLEALAANPYPGSAELLRWMHKVGS